MEQKNYFAVIPASVRYDKRLKPLARLLYGEITALCNDKGYCWASNSYFAELYETTNETISRYISQLKEYGYIKIDYNKAEQNIEKRKIYIAQIQYCQNNQDGIDRTVKGV
ncbi:helix-turn-helix domain-containing protein, partial [Brachyspira hyodysenteriae]